MLVASVAMGAVLWILTPLLLGDAAHAAAYSQGPQHVSLLRALLGFSVLCAESGAAATLFWAGCSAWKKSTTSSPPSDAASASPIRNTRGQTSLISHQTLF